MIACRQPAALLNEQRLRYEQGGEWQELPDYWSITEISGNLDDAICGVGNMGVV
jgi:hypothetical protein